MRRAGYWCWWCRGQQQINLPRMPYRAGVLAVLIMECLGWTRARMTHGSLTRTQEIRNGIHA